MTGNESALALFFILLIPCASAGLALINTGLGRSRNAAHSILCALCAAGSAALAYFVIGFALQGVDGGPFRGINAGGQLWSILANEPLLLLSLPSKTDAGILAALFGMFAVSVAAVIPLSSGSDRWRLRSVIGSSAILGGITVPLVAHWAWGGGFLAQLGVHYGLGHGFVDCGGAGAIHVAAGLTALAVTWILGARRGKYSQEGMPIAIPGHNTVFVVFGCFLAWVGWLGLDCAGSVLFAGVALKGIVLAAINATLGAAASGLTGAAITRSRFGKTDASLTANAWIGGLVATSAGCALMPPAAAVLIGVVSGGLVIFAIDWLELHLTIDDPGGAVSVHGLAGIWGLLAAGVFARFADGRDQGQLLAQLAGVATLLGFIFPMTYGLNWLLNRYYPQRVGPEAERQGLDLHELGASAYPDLSGHNDDAWPR